VTGETSTRAVCPLCDSPGGDLVWRNKSLRVVLPDEPDYPGFTRVIWRVHVAEMTDLDAAERASLMRVVWSVEQVQRAVLVPDKVNLASFGNVVPHLHWHVIPRWRDDRHFPQPVWGAPAQRDEAVTAARRLAVQALLPAYRAALIAALG
jgi:diadenosine tetraphosphate (Ap4A) HIT family hydrolase